MRSLISAMSAGKGRWLGMDALYRPRSEAVAQRTDRACERIDAVAGEQQRRGFALGAGENKRSRVSGQTEGCPLVADDADHVVEDPDLSAAVVDLHAIHCSGRHDAARHARRSSG